MVTTVPEGVVIGGFGKAAVAAETGGFASSACVEELIPLEAVVDVEGTDDTIICSPFVIGIVDTCVSPIVEEGNGLGGYPSLTAGGIVRISERISVLRSVSSDCLTLALTFLLSNRYVTC